MAAGDHLRILYEQLSKDPNSLANLDQDLPNYAQHQVPIFSLPKVCPHKLTVNLWTRPWHHALKMASKASNVFKRRLNCVSFWIQAEAQSSVTNEQHVAICVTSLHHYHQISKGCFGNLAWSWRQPKQSAAHWHLASSDTGMPHLLT